MFNFNTFNGDAGTAKNNPEYIFDLVIVWIAKPPPAHLPNKCTFFKFKSGDLKHLSIIPPSLSFKSISDL